MEKAFPFSPEMQFDSSVYSPFPRCCWPTLLTAHPRPAPHRERVPLLPLEEGRAEGHELGDRRTRGLKR